MDRLIKGGIIGTVIVFALAVLFFFQYKDPMVLAVAFQGAFILWVVLLIVRVMQRGIPVRVVKDEREE